MKPAAVSTAWIKRIGCAPSRNLGGGNPATSQCLASSLKQERSSEAERGFRVVGEASNGEAVISMARQAKPDVLLLGVTLPQTNGIEVLRRLAAAALPVSVLVLTV